MYDCYYGDASTVETSVFKNAEILVRLFFQAITQKVLLYTEAPKHRLVEQEIFECPQFFGVWGAWEGPSFSLPLYSLKPSAFLLLSIPFFSISSFSLPFHPSPSLLSPAPRRTLSKLLNDGVRRREWGIKWEWEWEKGEGEGRERRGRVRKGGEKKPL